MHQVQCESRPATARFVAVLLAATAAEATVVCAVFAGPGFLRSVAAPILTLMVLAYIVAIASAAFRCLWNPVLVPYPKRNPLPGAVTRNYQSFGLGIVNMGGSIHAAVDDDHLHLTPLAVWRWLGARPTSIPWSVLSPVGRTGRVARVGGPRGCKLEGPAWCMSLVSPTLGEASSDINRADTVHPRV